MPIYTYANLGTDIKDDYTSITNIRRLINRAVREVVSEIDLKSTKRNSVLAPNLFDDIHDYTLPSDYKALIDIAPQVSDARIENSEWTLVSEEEFDRKKNHLDNLVSVVEDDFVRRIRISKVVDDKGVVLGRMESLNGDGDTWVGFGGINDSDVKKDGDDYVKGNAAIRFSGDGTNGDTAVGLQNKGLDAVDLSDYLANGSVFVRGRLTTGDTNIKQLNVRIGSDTSNFYQVSDSTTNENTAFVTGWNLVRLDFSGKTTTGSPADTALDYVAAFWSKDSDAHSSDTAYAFDHIEAKKGKIYNIIYYTQFGWQGAGTYLRDSTADTDELNANVEEYQLFILKGKSIIYRRLGLHEEANLYRQEYNELKQEYLNRFPSERKDLTSIYWESQVEDPWKVGQVDT